MDTSPLPYSLYERCDLKLLSRFSVKRNQQLSSTAGMSVSTLPESECTHIHPVVSEFGVSDQYMPKEGRPASYIPSVAVGFANLSHQLSEMERDICKLEKVLSKPKQRKERCPTNV